MEVVVPVRVVEQLTRHVDRGDPLRDAPECFLRRCRIECVARYACAMLDAIHDGVPTRVLTVKRQLEHRSIRWQFADDGPVCTVVDNALLEGLVR
jgi:hypothetical protein